MVEKIFIFKNSFIKLAMLPKHALAKYIQSNVKSTAIKRCIQ